MNSTPQSGLYILSTPIGNLSDITYRAVEILKQVDWIAAEDTRHSHILLQHYGINTPVKSLHAHNESTRAATLIADLKNGKSIALISDAGTPLISDPGYRLVAEVRAENIPVFTVPGACAAIAALSISGLPTDAFRFVGFLPSKGAVRLRTLENLLHETSTLIFYESPKRVADLFQELETVFGKDRIAVIARELTKRFESVVQGTIAELLQALQTEKIPCRGEFVVLVKGAIPTEEKRIELDWKEILLELMKVLPLKQAVTTTVQLTKVAKNIVYQFALQSTPSKT